MMKRLFSWLMDIKSPDEEERRRGRTIVAITLGLIVIAVAVLPTLVFQPALEFLVIMVSLGISTLISLGVLALARHGKTTPSALILIASLTAIVFCAGVAAESVAVAAFYLVVPLLVASLCLRPWLIWAVLAVMILTLVLLFFTQREQIISEELALLTNVVLLLGVVALMSFLGARTINGAFQAASAARAQAEVAAQVLEHAKEELEVMVTERTAALQDALAEVQARADAQARLLAEVEQQRNIIREISVPVIPISKTALVIPLVGALDSARMLRVQEQALRSIERSSARHLVLDITGVPVVDSQVAEGLMSVMAAARLLGAQVMLVGIRPEVAQSIVGLALDLRGIYTASDLQSALRRIAPNHVV